MATLLKVFHIIDPSDSSPVVQQLSFAVADTDYTVGAEVIGHLVLTSSIAQVRPWEALECRVVLTTPDLVKLTLTRKENPEDVHALLFSIVLDALESEPSHSPDLRRYAENPQMPHPVFPSIPPSPHGNQPQPFQSYCHPQPHVHPSDSVYSAKGALDSAMGDLDSAMGDLDSSMVALDKFINGPKQGPAPSGKTPAKPTEEVRETDPASKKPTTH